MTVSCSHVPPIRALPDDVRAQIRSSSTLNSLNDVVLGLLKNALDASASSIRVEVDHARGACTVLDNGVGIPAAAFAEGGGLGELHHTSKFPPSSRLYGRQGLFLASVSAMSLLTISSTLHGHSRQPLIALNCSRIISRLEDAQDSKLLGAELHGTYASVNSLFGNLPVRVKQMVARYEDPEKRHRDFEELKRLIVGLFLASSRRGRILLIMKGEERRVVLRDPRLSSESLPTQNMTAGPSFHLDSITSILAQAGYIPTSSAKSWTTISARSSSVSIRAAISPDPAPSKHVQFVSIGINPIGHQKDSIIHNEINKMFTLSTFGMTEDDIDVDEEEQCRRAYDKRFKRDTFTNRQLRGSGRGVDRWPMFYIRLDIGRDQEADHPLDVAEIVSANETHKILELLRSMVTQFLEQKQFRPKSLRRRKLCLSDSDHSADGRSTKQGLVEGSHAGQKCGRDHLSEAKKAIGSDSKPTQKHDGPSRPQTKLKPIRQPFSTWSRIKASSPILIDELSCKLSSRKSGTGPQQRPESHYKIADNDFRPLSPIWVGSSPQIQELSPRDKSMDAPVCYKQRLEPQTSKCPASQQSDPTESENRPREVAIELDGEIHWMNPVTSQEVRINSRTGLVLHDQHRNSQSPMSANNSPPTLTNRHVRLRHTSLRTQSSPKGYFARKMLQEWDNPVFRSSEAPIPIIASHDACELPEEQMLPMSMARIDKAFGEPSHPLAARLDKGSLTNAIVLGQIDRKFILVKVHVNHLSTSKLEDASSALALIDQHAADERCRIEQLLENLFQPFGESNNGSTTFPGVNTSVLPQSIVFETSRQELNLFQTHQEFFSAWGIVYKLNSKPYAAESASQLPPSTVSVTAVPTLIAERCRLDHKALIDLLRREIWVLAEKPPITNMSKPTETVTATDWPARLVNCPKGILDMLCSRACRSAIMFNDPLTVEECGRLVRRLAGCRFPFICAHGRKSLVMLGGLDYVAREEGSGEKGFMEKYREWQGL